MAPPAFACGGFFCNNATPVNQAAERIIFAMDGDRVTQIVEVMYEGPAEGFSWVLPVPGTPEPGVSSVQALDRLQSRTNPTYNLRSVFDDACLVNQFAGGDGDAAGDGDGDGDGDGPTVTVIDSGSVGPFNYETISIDAGDEDPAEVAVRWLTDNDYDAGPRAGEVLGPYLQNGLNLIAFKLQKGRDAGAIRPIALEYDASAAAIPILPTSVAANDDMPIMVWVLGEHRAVPTNYKALELNEALIDWFTFASNYNEVVTAAADEARGQGFVTELAESTAGYGQVIFPSWESATFTSIAGSTDVEDVLVTLTERFALYDGFAEVAADLPLRDGISPEDFMSCPYCYFYPGTAPSLGFGGAPGEYDETPIPDTDPIYGVDLEAFVMAVEEDVLSPIARTATLFDEHPYVTRLYTTMSADEMTLDPVFEFNPDLEDVDNNHTAEWHRSCDDGPWSVHLEDGRIVRGTGTSWPYSVGDDSMPANVRILQYSTSGPPEVLTDNEVRIRETLAPRGSSSESDSDDKGGCALGRKPEPRSSWLWLLPIALGGLRVARRRLALRR